MQEKKQVKLIVVGGKSQNVEIAPQGTVKDALKAAGVSSDGYQIRAGGREVTLDEVLESGTKLVLARAVQGN